MSETIDNTVKDSSKVLGTLKETIAVAQDFFSGLISVPIYLACMPTTIRTIREDNEANTQAEDSLGERLFNFYRDETACSLGLSVSSLFLGYHLEDAFAYVSDKPELVLIPAVTNLLGAGYERWRKNE